MALNEKQILEKVNSRFVVRSLNASSSFIYYITSIVTHFYSTENGRPYLSIGWPLTMSVNIYLRRRSREKASFSFDNAFFSNCELIRLQ